jgi:uncharacterized membrane protein
MPTLDKKELIKSILDETELLEDEEEIIDLLVREKISKNVNALHKKQETLASRASDKMARFVGSWGFVIIFVVMIIVWIAGNQFLKAPFDPYPFILLNLALSCIAAIQAPIIMMSQNRQEEKDRLRSQNDYKVNIKSELIIEDLHKKIDQLIENQRALLEKIGKE